MPVPPQISILIVAWHSGPALFRCLASLSPDYEVVVCDNASDAETARVVAREFPHVTLLSQPRNLGFAGGVNAARRVARAPKLLLLNPDTVAEPGAVERLSARLDAEPSVAAVAGRLEDADGKPQRGFNVRRFPTLASLAADLLLLDHVWPDNPASFRYYARDLDPDSPAEVEQPAAACLMVRAEAFDAIGGFDERFFPAWWEDVDFCRRLRSRGYRSVYEPAAVFRHEGGSSVAKLGAEGFTRAYYGNLRRYVRKHHGAGASVVVRALIAVGLLLRAGVSILRGNGSAARAFASAALSHLRR